MMSHISKNINFHTLFFRHVQSWLKFSKIQSDLLFPLISVPDGLGVASFSWPASPQSRTQCGPRPLFHRSSSLEKKLPKESLKELREQIEMVKDILANGYGYEMNGSVYFDTRCNVKGVL